MVSHTRDDKKSSPSPRILVIESERDLREVLQELFLSEGWRVTTAPDGATGLEAFISEPPACVVCAYRLDDTDGLHIATQFKNQVKHIPVVIISAVFEDGIEQRSLEHGADAFFLKPFDIESLLNSMRRLLQT
ncbi:MAG: response regulator [Aggregatilineales bacterium]